MGVLYQIKWFMENKTKNMYITSDNSITMKGSGLVTINTHITIYGTETKLPINIVADFNKIPNHLHQMYFECLKQQYYNETYNK